MIELNEKHFIGKGRERLCYQHPNHQNLCIKISLDNRHRKYEESVKEFNYFNKYLKKKSGNLPIAEPVSWVQTNLGKGLTYELIRDFDGTVSKSIHNLLARNIISMEDAIDKMEELKAEFCEKLISPIDLSPKNILVQKISETRDRLVMIDGYGTKNLLPVEHVSKLLGRRQIAKRFDRHISQLASSFDGNLQVA